MADPLPDRALGSADSQERAAGASHLGELIGRLASQGAHLAQEQVALIQAEVRESVSDIRSSIAAYATAGIFALAGLGVTLTGAGWLIGEAMDNVPLGISLTGIATLLLAAFLYAGARRKGAAADLKPQRTLRTLEDTPDILSGPSSIHPPTTPRETPRDHQ